jgi:predicted peptidase
VSQPLPHLLYEPTGGESPFPLIVFLHGSGERGDGSNLELVKKYGVPTYIEQGNTLPAYVLAPQCPLGVGWHQVISRLDRTIDEVIGAHPIDTRRITITGFSMGGYGAWAYVTENQARFAAMLPVAGTALSHKLFLPKINPCAIGVTPAWIIQSEGDPLVPAQRSDQVVTFLIECGALFTYTRYDEEDHGDAARRAYSDPAIYEWLLAQVKA